jgi:hypothetical protein
MAGAEKNRASVRIEGRKKIFFFLISEMEGQRIRNPKI